MTKVLTPSTSFSIGPVKFKPECFYVIAGPCSIESPEQFKETASFVKEFGASILRGGVYKMRTNPQSFQGVVRGVEVGSRQTVVRTMFWNCGST